MTNRRRRRRQLPDRPLRLALVGRPNVKIIPVQQLLGEERSSPAPKGLTRDAITASWKEGDRDAATRHGRPAQEGAGGGETLEEMSVASTLEASVLPIA
jgi:predicted GTPase